MSVTFQNLSLNGLISPPNEVTGIRVFRASLNSTVHVLGCYVYGFTYGGIYGNSFRQPHDGQQQHLLGRQGPGAASHKGGDYAAFYLPSIIVDGVANYNFVAGFATGTKEGIVQLEMSTDRTFKTGVVAIGSPLDLYVKSSGVLKKNYSVSRPSTRIPPRTSVCE
jgi:hypothetical protein